jgi:hypothetical protein
MESIPLVVKHPLPECRALTSCAEVACMGMARDLVQYASPIIANQ